MDFAEIDAGGGPETGIQLGVALASRRCGYSLIGPRRAPDPSAKERERLYEKRVHAGQRRVCVDTWTNRLVLRLSLQRVVALVLRLQRQSEDETIGTGVLRKPAFALRV